jgi:broad specificity phosphatase PhoE
MRTLVLVRHGETIGNSSIRYYGRTDVELSELGRRQMHATRRWLRHRLGGAGFATVFASPLRRAAEGAAIIAGAGRSPVKIEEFVEVDFGRFEGLTAGEIEARFPADFARWNRYRLDPGFVYPGGESRADFGSRVERGIQRMLEVIEDALATGDDAALVVAHRGVIRIIARRLAAVEPAIELGSIQILRRDEIADAWRAEIIDAVASISPSRIRSRRSLETRGLLRVDLHEKPVG